MLERASQLNPTPLMTAEELMKLPMGEGFRYELIDGELITMPASGYPHGRATARLAGPLEQFVFEHDLGEVFAAETGFKLTSNPDTVLAPDISFITKQRHEEWGEPPGFLPGSPNLVVEVLSPDDRPSEVKAKTSLWFSGGAGQVWIVNPKNRTVTIHRSLSDSITFSGSDELEADDILPGFRISLDRIFGPATVKER
ncbi:MAG TPA: Uma2 family endonuclease [Pyrinomonadaceae bacterium]|nr:Uma2 family endonuclease [Pyrinomonadaceae bacterium]